MATTSNKTSVDNLVATANEGLAEDAEGKFVAFQLPRYVPLYVPDKDAEYTDAQLLTIYNEQIRGAISRS